jgi:DNA repair exonuclease SbcCD ATPase subunit
MKILKIESKNFKPFDNISIPYEGYLGEGFFFIKGKNSMGKTSIIESILWGLLGEHLMAERDRKSLIKTGESKCEVAITFEISDIVYRVIRTIEVTKKRSFHNPQNDSVKSSALLFKKERNEDKFIQLCRGPNIVNQEIESLLGVYPEVIEKTVYIRQKEVDKLALADPSELRELIKKLFGLNDFDEHIKKNLKNQVNSVNEEVKDLKIQIGSLLTEQNELEKQKQILKEKEEKLELKLEEIKNEKDNLIKFPLQEQLYEIKKYIENIEKYKKDLEYTEKMYTYKKESLLVQENRIKDFQDKIILLDSKIVELLKELQEYPPKDSIRRANDILKGIDNDEKQIKNLILKSNEKLNIDIHNISIHNIEELKKVKEKNQLELEKTDKERISILSILEEHKKLLTSNQLLYEIQTNSIEYIQDSDTCPICSSSINENKETLIFDLKQERENISHKENLVKKEINLLEKKLKKTEIEFEEKKEARQLIEVIDTIINGIVEKQFNFYDELNSISEVYKKYDELTNLNSKIIDDLISTITKIENNIFSSKELVKNFKDRIESEKIKFNQMEKEINRFKNDKNDIFCKLQSNKLSLQKYCDNLKVLNINNLLENFHCNGIDQLISKRLDISIRIEEKTKIIENIQGDISFLIEDIQLRRKKIINLRSAEEKLKENEYLLKHLLFLLGEVDGFISTDIVEGRLSDILMKSTNFYLIPFTEGRYEIINISSTMRKIKDRISHGLTLTLVDNKDNITKNKEQLSGGDESALGLALRISISKLMSTIRPFKHVEKKVPMINFIIMDEPLTSLDEFRRNVIMNILMKDQSFKQIFLISHAEINEEENNYHSIVINDNENSKRMVEYFH